MKRTSQKPEKVDLIPLAVDDDVDLIRFEKNLLQIGFFGANDARDKNRTSRRIEQIVFRNGNKVRVAAEFRGSDLLGLPSTTDRDKFIALLKIVHEERARRGTITNPIRFSGYRMIQELGLSRNGEIYEEILRWGKRMTDTTITSEQVVYFAAKKVYSDEVLHVFRSFRRTGSSRLNGSEKQEHYEVVLEDWILENLNQRYVIPEDFNAYKRLTRPTAKGIFGNLHLWFHASAGRPVEKDYAELCNLLSIQAYPHLSKIRSTMGLALEELVGIGYLSKWDVEPMSSKKGYKIVLTPGDDLLDMLRSGRGDHTALARLEPPVDATLEPVAPPVSEPTGKAHTPAVTRDRQAMELLMRHGVLQTKARHLVKRFGASAVSRTVDYLESQMKGRSRGGSIENPAGLIVHSLENNLPIPAGFDLFSESTLALAEQAQPPKDREPAEAEAAYERWVEEQKESALAARFTPAELNQRIAELVKLQSRKDEAFRRVPAEHQPRLIRRVLVRELMADLALPSLEEWIAAHPQQSLF